MERRRVLEDDLGFLLTRASAMVVRSVNEALAPLGLRVCPYTVLSLACDEPAGVAQRRIAADMGLDPSQIVAIVDELESRGLVARTADPGDRRNKLIVATDEGRKLCDEARRLSEEVSDRHFAGANPALLTEMRNVLGRMVFPESVNSVS